MRDLLTVVMVTSPIFSHPSTELIDACMASYLQLDEFLGVKFIVAADGCTVEPRGRRRGRIFGRAEPEEAEAYMKYLRVLQTRAEQHPTQLELVRSVGWRGFGMTLRAALLRVTTPFVLVTCHDLSISRQVPTRRVLKLLAREADTHVRYVGVPGPNNYGRRYIIRASTPEFKLAVTERHDGLPLVPLLRWKENTHFARTDTYLRFIFDNPGFHRFRRGHFIEETFGQLMVKQIRAAPDPAAMHDQFGTYLLYFKDRLDPSELPPIVHINGRNYLTVRARLDAPGVLSLKLHSYRTAHHANWFTQKFCGHDTFTPEEIARLERDHQERMARGERDDDMEQNEDDNATTE